jgi:hypothetical protein
MFQKIEPGLTRHIEVRYDQIDMRLLQVTSRLGDVARKFHFKTAGAKVRAQKEQNVYVIID